MMLYEVQPALGNAHRIPSAYFLSDTGSYLVKPYGEKIVHSGVKAPNLAW